MPDDRLADQLTTTEHALLGMLARYGESSGYELLKQARGGIAFFWSPARSHVYDVLPRLERSGHAARRLVPQDGRPDKHLWRLTPRGRFALRRWIETPDPDPFADSGLLLLKLFFGDHGDPAALVALVERFAEQARERDATYREIDAEDRFDAPAALPRMTLSHGLARVRAQLDWAEAILPELRARVRAPSPVA